MLPVRLTRTNVPFRGLDLFEGLDRWPFGPQGNSCVTTSSFKVDVQEDENGLIVEAELPGIARDKIDITVEKNILTIAAEQSSDTEEKKETYHIRERRLGRYERSFRLPETANADGVVAELKEGLLTLRIPKHEEVKPKKITVN